MHISVILILLSLLYTVGEHYKRPVRQTTTQHYDVPRTPSSSSSSSSVVAAAAVAEMTEAELLTADTGNEQKDQLLFTPRDRADVTMTSGELNALLTE